MRATRRGPRLPPPPARAPGASGRGSHLDGAWSSSALLIERLDDDVGQPKALAQLERPLDVSASLVASALEERAAGPAGRTPWRSRSRRLGLVGRERSSSRATPSSIRLVEEQHLAEPYFGARCLGVLRRRRRGSRSPLRAAGQPRRPARPRPRARPHVQATAALDVVRCELCGPFERALRLERRGERRGAVGGAREPAARLARTSSLSGASGSASCASR